MKLVLKSTKFAADYTEGELSIDGDHFCFTVEDHYPTPYKKTPKKTAIPAGTYEVVVTKSPKFGRDLPIILAVPFFTGIRMHAGVDADSSEGCVIVGFVRGPGKVGSSRVAETELTKLLKAAQDRHVKITIDVLR